MKKCAIILPYFGKFNNYFELFLKSCAYNETYEWIIFTDDMLPYKYPSNVHCYKSTLHFIKELAEKKLKMEISLERPYKLCDYKPMYGLIFEDYLSEYEYWGHCDCDLIFGDLESILTPILNQGYDKIFAAGHLTLYKNTYKNNRIFMSMYHKKYFYREVVSNDKNYIFDEDFSKHNIHSIFLEQGAKVYCKDLSMNSAINSGKYIRDAYSDEKRKFIKEEYLPARYYWSNGKIIRAHIDGKKVIYSEFLYMHFQMRNMRLKIDLEKDSIVEILPDRFIKANKIPRIKKDMRIFSLGFSYLYWLDEYKKKIKRKIKKLMEDNNL